MSFHRGSVQRGKGLGGVIGSLYKGVLPAGMMIVEAKVPVSKKLPEEDKEEKTVKVLSAVKTTSKQQKSVKKEKKEAPKTKKRKVSYGDIFDAENSLSDE
jgi:hypothetical protein